MKIYKTLNLITLYDSINDISITLNKDNILFSREYDMLYYTDLIYNTKHDIGAYYELLKFDDTRFTNVLDAYEYLTSLTIGDNISNTISWNTLYGITIVNKLNVEFIKEWDMLYYIDTINKQRYSIGAYFELLDSNNIPFTNSILAYQYLVSLLIDSTPVDDIAIIYADIDAINTTLTTLTTEQKRSESRNWFLI